ncbi:hypothetical protein GCK72_016076 [Caenorhabditis remanei]|uniref:Fe2OG dioxygenase domain-containing protein n=1 Tax=Caenorhabditis remanei TaxID=31234 RepID=A0A6A5GY67_CAERE|nr:hypothetical protein GCK72_016076 [Caenorhabditis remanei]KAF1759609.1 hypothetical protein GCK72_016076 [Caenorhabditis remanei]
MMREGAESLEQKGAESDIRDQYAEDSSDSDSGVVNEFKAVFKKYKKRRPPPDFSDVIDVRTSSLLESRLVFPNPSDITAEKEELANRLGLISLSKWRVYSFPTRPGLYLIPGLLKKEQTKIWLKRAFGYANPPNITNLTIHGKDVKTDPSLLTKALRWTTLGVEYDWNTKQYPPNGRPVPEELYQLGNLISNSLKLGDMRPDATILNYYPPKSALSPHVDKSERSNAPLISMSLGQSAVYLSGALTLSEPPIPLWLRNGDFLVMHGEQRLVYHAIPCIGPKIEKQHFETNGVEEDSMIVDYLNCSRINFTIRQVNP